MIRFQAIAFHLVLAVVLSGCSPRQPTPPSFTVKIDAIRSEGSVGKQNYILLPGNKDTDTGDLQYQEFAAYVHRALQIRGYIPVTTNEEEADIVIFLAYGVGDPQENLSAHSVSMPMPFAGMRRSQTYVDSITTHLRFVVIGAISYAEYKSTGKYVPAWKTTVTSRGTSSDLRRVVPVLVAGASDYLGTDTGTQVTVVLKETDEKVAAIKAKRQSD